MEWSARTPLVHEDVAAVGAGEALAGRKFEPRHRVHPGVHRHEGAGAREAEEEPFAGAGSPPSIELDPAQIQLIGAPGDPVVQDPVGCPAHEPIARRDVEVLAGEWGFRALLLGQRGERAHPRLDPARLHVEKKEPGVPRHLLARRVADVREACRSKRLGRVDLADAEVLGGDQRRGRCGRSRRRRGGGRGCGHRGWSGSRSRRRRPGGSRGRRWRRCRRGRHGGRWRWCGRRRGGGRRDERRRGRRRHGRRWTVARLAGAGRQQQCEGGRDQEWQRTPRAAHEHVGPSRRSLRG